MSRGIIREIEINEISKKIKDLFEDNNWFIQFHKRWFWAIHGRKFGARLIVKKNGEIITSWLQQLPENIDIYTHELAVALQAPLRFCHL